MKHPVPTVYSIQICIYPILTHTEPICIVVRVLAKSRARIETRQYKRRNNSRQMRRLFFCCGFSVRPVYDGLEGLS